mgnify:FL=1
MTGDIAYDTAGLDAVGNTYATLAKDSHKVSDYWQREAVDKRAFQASTGLPGMMLPTIGEMTPNVSAQCQKLDDHITKISEALHESAAMYRKTEEGNVDQVRNIFSGVEQGDDDSGMSSGGMPHGPGSEDKLPSDMCLTDGPKASGPFLYEPVINILTMAQELKGEVALVNALDELLGWIFGEKPTDYLEKWFSVAGDWKALGEIADIFQKFADHTGWMQRFMCHNAKDFSAKAKWEGESADTARDRIFGAANKLDGLQEIWRKAHESYDAWQMASYVLLKDVETVTGDVLGALADAKKILNKFGDLIAVGLDMATGIFTGENHVWEALKKLFGLAIAIIKGMSTTVKKALLILQGFVTFGALAGALLTSGPDLGADW